MYWLGPRKFALLIYTDSSKGRLFSEYCFKDSKINVENFTLGHWFKNCKVHIIIYILNMKKHSQELLKKLQL